nr:MutH/Sau3AI family endonuclease [uncultured Blautia sp.]
MSIHEINLLEEIPHYTTEQIYDILIPTIGKTLAEVDVNHVFDKTVTNSKVTGIAGDVIEQSVFGYKANNKQIPDLNVDDEDVELKTIGIQEKSRNVWKAKEPCSITAVSISTIELETFETSKFWHKSQRILFVYYHYLSKMTIKAAEYKDFPLKNFYFYNCSADDKAIIASDWQKVHDFITDIHERYSEEEIRKEEYPNLSTVVNKQLEYLDTSPKYPNSPRFRFRARFVTVIVQSSINNTYEQSNRHYLGINDVEKECREYTRRYRGKTLNELCREFGVDNNLSCKQAGEKIIAKMFGGTRKISQIEQLAKLGLHGQIVVLNKNGGRTEDMKLSACPLDFSDFQIIDGEEKVFEDTDVYNFFNDYRLLCPVFQEHPRISVSPNRKIMNTDVVYGDNTFEGFKILELGSDEIMSSVRKSWEEAKRLVQTGELTVTVMRKKDGSIRYTPKTGIEMMETNLPKALDNVIFFRGTGSDATDKVTVNGLKILRQNYWVKGTYVVEQLNKLGFIGE